MDELATFETKNYILALVIRSDDERLLLGDGAFEFKESQLHFLSDTYANDVVELQGADGQLLAGQVIRSNKQDFDGYIGDASLSKPQIEEYRLQFLRFFRKNFFYKVVYIFADGTAIQRKRGYIVDAPAVPELWQRFPEWHVALNFEDPDYYEYAENEEGEETYAHTAILNLSNVTSGGLVWDNVGTEWDSIGAVWEAGGADGPTTVTVIGVDDARPIWKVEGQAINPTVTNITTGQTLTWNGTVPAGQTLIVDMNEMTATLEGANVFEFISGSWITLKPGNNTVAYTADNDAPASTLSWNGVVG